MDDFEAQKQISYAYQEGLRDGREQNKELTVLLKQFIIDDIKNWTDREWNIFDEHMETFK